MSKSFSIMKIIFNYSDWAGSLEVECPPRMRVVLVCYEIINKIMYARASERSRVRIPPGP